MKRRLCEKFCSDICNFQNAVDAKSGSILLHGAAIIPAYLAAGAAKAKRDSDNMPIYNHKLHLRGHSAWQAQYIQFAIALPQMSR
jgi:hypothetical protein